MGIIGKALLFYGYQITTGNLCIDQQYTDPPIYAQKCFVRNEVTSFVRVSQYLTEAPFRARKSI